MNEDPREEKKNYDLIDDPELCESLEDNLEEDELTEENELLAEDPWEQQVRMGKQSRETKYSIW